MKSIRLFGIVAPIWLLLVTSVVALSIVGITYALVMVLNQYSVGYIQIGESKSFVILSTNTTISPGNLNLSTVATNPNSISASLSWKDDSGISRTSALVMDGNTTFIYPILGPLNLTVVGASQGSWNITITMINSTSTFLNYKDVV